MANPLLKEKFAGIIAEENAKGPEVPAPPVVGDVYDQPPAPTPLQQRFQGHIDEEARIADQGTAIALDAARIENPKLYNKAKEIAGLNDLPPDVVHRNIGMFEEREKLEKAREVLRSNPTLAEWFAQGDNAKTVSVENLEAANGVSWMLKAGNRAWSQGGDTIEVADIRYKQIFGLASKQEIERADQLESMFQDDFGGASWIGRGFTGALSNLPIMGDIAEDAFRGATGGAAIGAGVGSVVPGIGTLAGASAGAVGGGGTMAFRRSMQINSALAFSEYSKFRGNDGKKIDHDTAAGAALIAGSLAAGLDTASFGIMLKATGIGSVLTRLGAKAGIKEALKNTTFRQIAASVGKRFAGAIGAETVTEAIQEGVQIAAGEVIKQMEGGIQEGFKPVGVAEALGRMGEAGRDAALATAFLGIVPMGGRLAIDYSAAKRQVDETTKIKQLGDLAKKDPLVKENPAKAAELVAEAVAGSDKDTLYLDTASVKEFMQEEESPELAALSRIPEFQKRLQEAVQTGGDVAIPTADFYAYVATDDAASGVIKKLKFSPEGMSEKEATAFVKAVEKIKEKGIPELKQENSVGVDIFEKTRKAGATPDQARQYAALYSAFFDSMATQTGRTSWDIYRSYNLDITTSTDSPPVSALATFKQTGLDSLARLAQVRKTFTAPTPLGEARIEILDRGKLVKGGSKRVQVNFYIPGLPNDGGMGVGGAVQSTFTYQDRGLAGDGFHVQNPEHRRQGLGSSLYDYVEKYTGEKLNPSWALDDGGFAFWSKRDPDALKDHRPVVWNGEKGYFRREYFQQIMARASTKETRDNAAAVINEHFTDGDTFAQTVYTQENYANLERLRTWKDIPAFENTSRDGTEHSLVIAPDGAIFRLPEQGHANWGQSVPNPTEAVRVSGYWSRHDQTFEWNSRFTTGQITPAQQRQLLKLAAFSGHKRGDLIVKPTSYSDLGHLGDDPQQAFTIRPLQPMDDDFPTVDKFFGGSFGQGQDLPQGGAKGSFLRGAITFGPDKTTIRLFKNANLSTLLHETGHLFLQVMADLVDGKRAYGGEFFQNDEVLPGDRVLVYDPDGNEVSDGPQIVTSVRSGAAGIEFYINKKWVSGANYVIVAKPDDAKRLETLSEELRRQREEDGSDAALEAYLKAAEEKRAGQADAWKKITGEQKAAKKQADMASEEPSPLPVGESPAEDPAALGEAPPSSSPPEVLSPEDTPPPSPPEVLSPEDTSHYESVFDSYMKDNAEFREFAEGKAQSTPLDKRNLLVAFIPSSPPEVLSPEDTSYFDSKFNIIVEGNRGFRNFVEGKPQSTPLEKRNLLFEFFPKSKEAMAYRQAKARAEQNADPRFNEILKNAGIENKLNAQTPATPPSTTPSTPAAPPAERLKKINPLGVQTEELAALNIDQTIEVATSIVTAAQKLQAQLSGKQSNRYLTALRFTLRQMRRGSEEGSVNEAAWAELQAEVEKIQPGIAFSEKVKTVVDEFIKLYKKDEAASTAKAESKAKREGQAEARQVEAARKEDIASAINELSSVIDRVEKIEQQKVARQQLIDDMKVLQDWMGEKGPLFSTKAHEQFAVGFEAYLMEGVAPSEGLRRAFDRFKTWLKLVYRKIANLGVQPTAEVKAVFDRMLVSDQAINNAISSPAFQASFQTAEEMGVSQEEFDAYQGRVRALAEVGREAADKVITAEAQKLRTKAVQDKKKELRKEYRDDLMAQRVYRVINYLQGNKLGGDNGLTPVKLDRKRVEAIVGKGKLNTIPNGPSMWTKEGGAEPNVVATMFGYQSGAEMMADIASVEPLKIAVEDRVNKTISQMTEEELVVPEEVAEMAEAKLRSEVYQEFLKDEIRTYSKLMGIDFTEAHVAQFKRMADDIISEKRVRTVLRRNFLREYTEADRKIGALLDKAIKAKNHSEILDLRRKQFFNSFLIQKAYETKAKTEAGVKYLRGFTKSKSTVIDQDYLSQIRNMVIGVGIIKGQIDPTAMPFSRFLDQELDSGSMIVVDPRVKKQSNKAYMHLSSDEFLAIHDAVKNLDFMGRNKRKIFKEGKVLDLQMVVAEIKQAMENNLIPPRGGVTLNRRGFDRWKQVWQGYFAAHTKIEQLCDWIDGRQPQGPAHKYIFQPMADAQAREVEMTQQFATKALEIINQKEPSYWADEILVNEIGKRVTRAEVLSVALNMGNESNLKKLKKGMGWTDAQLAAVTQHMDKTDWEIAQQLWDTIDGLWPSVLEVAARTGIPRPDKVEPVSFTNAHGTFKGGYYPVVYDPSKSADALARGLTTKAEQQFGFQPQSVFPSKSFANDRDNEYARPILLDMRVLPEHIAKVVHYVTHAEPAYNVQKIMSHPDFKDRLLAQFGEAMFSNMKGWIENITRGEIEPSGLGGANRFMRALRRNISLAALGFRATTVIAQAGGVFSGAEMIGMSGVGRGIKEMYGSMSIEQIQANFEMMRQKSPEMRHRTQFLDRDLTNISAAFTNTTLLTRVKDMAMKPMMAADNIVASAVWMGAYTRQISRDVHDEAKAVAYADKVVRLSQGAAGAKDLAAVQRGNEFFRLFTMFYTYFAAMQNRLQDVARTAYYKTQKGAPEIPGLDTPNEVVRYIYLIVLPSVIFDFMMKGALQGDFDEEKEKEKSLLGSALWKIASYSMAGMVGVRDLVNFVGKDGFEWRYSAPPLLRNIEMMLERAGRLGTAVTDEEKDVKPSDAVRTGIDLLGVTTGLPADAPSLILQNYLKAQEKGEEIGPADFFVRR